MKPIPFPMNPCDSMSDNTSSFRSSSIRGSDSHSLSFWRRSRIVPQASSPMTIGCMSTLLAFNLRDQLCLGTTHVVNPYRRVHEDHSRISLLRRRMYGMSGSLPPIMASRLAAIRSAAPFVAASPVSTKMRRVVCISKGSFSSTDTQRP